MNSINTITLSETELIKALESANIIPKPINKYTNYRFNLIPDGLSVEINSSDDPTDPILYSDNQEEESVYYDSTGNTWTG